jgi:hypothetical protein
MLENFFRILRRTELHRALSKIQVQNYELILAECASKGLSLEETAYVLATVYWETARTITPLEEYGKGRGKPYGKFTGPYHKAYYGRGFVQLTWLTNYKKMSDKFNENFLKFPDKAMEPHTAARILVSGMVDGDFTGKKLSDYYSNGKVDHVGARRIINGTDKKLEIASIARKFETALGKGKEKTTSSGWGPAAVTVGTGGTAVAVSQNPEYWPVVVVGVVLALIIGFVVWKKKSKK